MNHHVLNQERREQLQSAFNGANSLVLLFVFLLLSALPIWWISDKMTGWIQLTGLVMLSLFTAFILMLFLTGLIKGLLKILFKMASSEYRSLFDTK